MAHWWEELQTEYDGLLLKRDKSEQDLDRINAIEAALIRRWGPDALSIERIVITQREDNGEIWF